MTIAKHNFPAQKVDSVVDRAAAIYESGGLKFTELRRLVLEVVAEQRTPVGAYTIIRVLEERYRKLSPISVYRALNSLIKMGVVRKVKTQNAYFVAESVMTRTKQPSERRICLICEVCNRVTETSSAGAYDLIEQASNSALFKLAANTVEVSGVCEACARPNAPLKPKATRRRVRGSANPQRRLKVAAR